MSQISLNRVEPGDTLVSQYAYMILFMSFRCGSKNTKTRDIFLILFMIGYWEIDINKKNEQPLIVKKCSCIKNLINNFSELGKNK